MFYFDLKQKHGELQKMSNTSWRKAEILRIWTICLELVNNRVCEATSLGIFFFSANHPPKKKSRFSIDRRVNYTYSWKGGCYLARGVCLMGMTHHI